MHRDDVDPPSGCWGGAAAMPLCMQLHRAWSASSHVPTRTCGGLLAPQLQPPGSPHLPTGGHGPPAPQLPNPHPLPRPPPPPPPTTQPNTQNPHHPHMTLCPTLQPPTTCASSCTASCPRGYAAAWGRRGRPGRCRSWASSRRICRQGRRSRWGGLWPPAAPQRHVAPSVGCNALRRAAPCALLCAALAYVPPAPPPSTFSQPGHWPSLQPPSFSFEPWFRPSECSAAA